MQGEDIVLNVLIVVAPFFRSADHPDLARTWPGRGSKEGSSEFAHYATRNDVSKGKKCSSSVALEPVWR